jgi:hypothetical protein
MMRVVRLVVLALALLLPAAAQASSVTAFATPSGNIVCVGFGKPQPAVSCAIRSGLKPPAPRVHPDCDHLDYVDDRIDLHPTGRAQPVPCEGDPGPLALASSAHVLAYGKTWRGDGVRCASARTGLTCTNRQGHGFFLSRERWRRF